MARPKNWKGNPFSSNGRSLVFLAAGIKHREIKFAYETRSVGGDPAWFRCTRNVADPGDARSGTARETNGVPAANRSRRCAIRRHNGVALHLQIHGDTRSRSR